MMTTGARGQQRGRPDGRPYNGRPDECHTRLGMTLIEVLVSIVILGSALMAMGAFIGRFAHTTKTAAFQQWALDLATDRIDLVKHAPTYAAGIDTMATIESITMDSTTYTRQTFIRRMGGTPGDTVDFKIVTVSVSQPALASPVSKTTYITSF